MPNWAKKMFVTDRSFLSVARSYLEKVEVDLFGISVLFFVHRHKKVLHIHHHAQQSVNLILRHILQVGHMIS